LKRLLGKPLRIGKYSVPALLLLSIVIGSVAAVAYVVMQFTLTATVQANPKVCFIRWSDSTKANTFNYAVNIFPSLKTIDENVTYGIWNWDTTAHTTSLRIETITNSGNIASITIYIKLGVTTVATITWSTGGSLPTSWVAFSAAASTKYTIWMEITAASGAVVGQTSVITLDMKVENP